MDKYGNRTNVSYDNIKDGVWISWYDNEHLRVESEISYKHGILHGILHGVYRQYYNNDGIVLKCEGFYLDDKQHS